MIRGLIKATLYRLLRRGRAQSATEMPPNAGAGAQLLDIKALIDRNELAAAAQRLAALDEASDSDVAMLKGLLALKRDDHSAAIECFERAVALSPRLGAAHAQLGALHAAAGEFSGAAESYRSALAAHPESANLHNNLGVAYLELDRSDDAAHCFEAALRLDPAFSAARNNLGRARRNRRDYAGALECFRAASSEFDARANAGFVLNDLGEHVAARDALLACAKERPDHAETQCGLGLAYLALAQLSDAERHFGAALALSPEHAEACFGLANIALLLGEFTDGWRLYESRIRMPRLRRYYRSEAMRWHGEPLPGRTLLVSAEQGYGDNLLFVRLLPLVKPRAQATVVFRCRPPLVRLFAGIFGVDRIVSDDDATVAHDAAIPLLSLAHVLGIARDAVPVSVHYIRAPDALAAQWRQRLAEDRRLRVGLVWGGNPLRAHDASRVPDAAAYAALAQVDGVSFYNLQVGLDAAALARVPLSIIDHSVEFTDFADTAALIQNLDLVIAVDTSVAHLAGAMGKPLWLLHPGPPDWRWEIDGSDSPWYPDVRIFRRHPKGWAATLVYVADALRGYARARGA